MITQGKDWTIDNTWKLLSALWDTDRQTNRDWQEHRKMTLMSRNALYGHCSYQKTRGLWHWTEVSVYQYKTSFGPRGSEAGRGTHHSDVDQEGESSSSSLPLLLLPYCCCCCCSCYCVLRQMTSGQPFCPLHDICYTYYITKWNTKRTCTTIAIDRAFI